ncbi:MAG: type VII toxin-antitoxin system MntA family adenylyltransferase antitoxin [Acidimicrobiia bacterium]
MSQILDNLRQGAELAFEPQPVLFAYLFGSQAEGETRPDSDVDVAVFVEPAVSEEDYPELSLRLADELSRAARLGHIEVVILNEAPLRFQGRVLQQRKVIYSRDEPRRVRFESITRRQFLDFEIHALSIDQALLQAIAEGRR